MASYIEIRNGIEIEFWEKSFAIREPITTEGIFMGREINTKAKIEIFRFIEDVIDKSRKLGKEEFCSKVRSLLGL